MVNFRLHHLLLRHFCYLRQGDEQALERSRRQGQVFLLPVQAGGEIAQRNGGVVDFDIDVMQRHAAEGNGVWRRQVQRAGIFFLYRRRRRHLFGIDSDVDITQRDIVNAQAAIPQAAQLDAEMELAGRHRYARLFEAHVL